MSLSFKETINVNNAEHVFEFTFTGNEANPRYSVVVNDYKGNPLTFSMFTDVNGQWRTFGPRLPLWIHNAEQQLSSVIVGKQQQQKAV